MKGSNQCPRCESKRTAHLLIDGQSISGCIKCKCLWEPFSPDALSIPEDLNSIFSAPCDNCAFRPGSLEREDPIKWQELQESLILNPNSVFYCHKGVPLSREEGQSHDHPRCPDGSYDTDKMRPCAGWLASRLGHIYKGYKKIVREAI